MSINVTQDLDCYFEDWGVDITLHPGDPEERFIEKGGVFSRPSGLAEVGGQIEQVTFPTTITLRTADAAALEKGAAIYVHPAPGLGVEGGDFKVSVPLPGEGGLTKLELIEA